MKNLNGWAKVLTLIVAIAIQLMVLSNNNGRRDEAITNLKQGQTDIKAKLDKIDTRINNHIEKHGK